MFRTTHPPPRGRCISIVGVTSVVSSCNRRAIRQAQRRIAKGFSSRRPSRRMSRRRSLATRVEVQIDTHQLPPQSSWPKRSCCPAHREPRSANNCRRVAFRAREPSSNTHAQVGVEVPQLGLSYCCQGKGNCYCSDLHRWVERAAKEPSRDSASRQHSLPVSDRVPAFDRGPDHPDRLRRPTQLLRYAVKSQVVCAESWMRRRESEKRRPSTSAERGCGSDRGRATRTEQSGHTSLGSHDHVNIHSV